MILLEAPVFSLTRELIVFAVFIGICIAAIVVIDLMYGPMDQPRGQRVLPGEGEILPEMEFPPELPADEEQRINDINECRDIEIFTKVEDYRHDFDGIRKSS